MTGVSRTRDGKLGELSTNKDRGNYAAYSAGKVNQNVINLWGAVFRYDPSSNHLTKDTNPNPDLKVEGDIDCTEVPDPRYGRPPQ